MSTGKLSKNVMIRTLASDLKLKPSDDPVSEIIRFCHKQVKSFLVKFPKCSNPVELLRVVAEALGTEFREIHTNDDLKSIQTEFLQQKESGFVSIHKELNGEVLGITLRRLNRQPFDRAFVSIIDCRGENKPKAYYTKWHELVHLLLLTDQSRLVFYRTHSEQAKNPEEALVDVVAGTLAFYPPMVVAHARGDISFDAIERVRNEIAPQASHQSALLGITKAWPKPCILVDAALAYKAGEVTSQGSFDFKKPPKRALRAVHVTPNDAAREIGVRTIRNFRVPKESVINSVFQSEVPYAEAVEELSWWTSAGNAKWEGGSVLVKAKKYGDRVQALMIPLKSRPRPN